MLFTNIKKLYDFFIFITFRWTSINHVWSSLDKGIAGFHETKKICKIEETFLIKWFESFLTKDYTSDRP